MITKQPSFFCVCVWSKSIFFFLCTPPCFFLSNSPICLFLVCLTYVFGHPPPFFFILHIIKWRMKSKVQPTKPRGSYARASSTDTYFQLYHEPCTISHVRPWTSYICYEAHCGCIVLQIWLEQFERMLFPNGMLLSFNQKTMPLAPFSSPPLRNKGTATSWVTALAISAISTHILYHCPAHDEALLRLLSSAQWA